MEIFTFKFKFFLFLLILFVPNIIPQEDNNSDETNATNIFYSSDKTATDYLSFQKNDQETLSTNSASYLAKSVSISVINKNLIDVIKYLAKESGVSIMYDDQLLNIAGITVDLKNVSLYKALDEILTQYDISFYEYENGKIALAKSRKISENTGGVQGIVKDTSGERLIGANIVIKELQIGSQTDSKGFYSIKNIKSGDYILEASFMGYRKFAKRVHIKSGSVLEINIMMVSTTFQIGGIEVYGTSELLPKDVSTKTVITSGEIEHFQASSIKDVLDLVPGIQKSDNPGLGKTSQISIRGDESNRLSAFGTLIIVDGSPVSNNANMQFYQATSAAMGTSNIGAGVDLRTIPADNIESIEVITGLPSVRYGDFTEGIINVQTKLGPSPNRLKIKNNPRLTEGNFNGGVLIGESGLNYRLNVARDERNIRLTGDEYYRFTGETILSNNFFDNQLNNNFKLSFQTVLDDENPKGDMQQINNFNHGYNLGVSTWGKFKPTDGVSTLEYNLNLNMNRQNDMRSQLKQSPMRIINGDTVASYIGKVETKGIAWNITGRIEWSRVFYTGDIIHKFLVGSEPQFNANTGQGVVLDSNFNYFGFDSKHRSYNFNSIPGQLLMNIYSEDKITGHFLFDFNIMLGFRYEMYRPKKFNLSGLWGKGDLVESHQGSFFNPRFSLMAYLSQDNQIRINVGTTSKSPSMSNLFPEELVYNWRNPLDSVVYYFKYNRRVPDLKGTREAQYELSFDQKISNLLGFSLSGYYKKRTNEPDDLTVPVFYSTVLNGQPLTYFIDSYALSTNFGTTESKGLELSFKTTKIKPLNLEIQITGSYSRFKSYSNIISYDPNPDLTKGRYPNYLVPGTDTLIGYLFNTGADWNDRLQLNYYFRYTHPTLGLWVTLRIEQVAIERNQDDSFEPEDLSLPNVSETEKTLYYFNRQIKTKPNKFLFNLNITKSLFSGAEVSFYVNNLLDDPAIYTYLSSPPSTYMDSSRNPSLFYGLEYSMTFDNLFRNKN
jgi:hypothetical protein